MHGQRRPRGWWYPYIFVGGFGVVLAVNLTLLYFATSTFSGLQTEDPYEKGVAYNEALAAIDAQQQLGWEVALSVAPAADSPKGADEPRVANVVVSFHDREGRPLDDLDVRARLRRPTVAGFDRKVLLPRVGEARYGTTVELPLPGQWQVDVVALWGDVTYQSSERVFLP